MRATDRADGFRAVSASPIRKWTIIHFNCAPQAQENNNQANNIRRFGGEKRMTKKTRFMMAAPEFREGQSQPAHL
jgi:hypothetical protein